MHIWKQMIFYQLFEPPWVTFLRFLKQDKDREKMGNCIMTEIHYEDYDIRKGKWFFWACNQLEVLT